MSRVKILPHELRNLGAEAEARIAAELLKPLTDRKPRARRGTGKVGKAKVRKALGSLDELLTVAAVPCWPGELVLPWPPSANCMWRTILQGGKPRTLLSHEARDYKARVRAIFGVALSAGAVTPMRGGPLAVELRLHPPKLGNRDIDNSIKPVLDSLNELLWRDDNLIERLVVELRERVDGGAVVVRAKKMEETDR